MLNIQDLSKEIDMSAVRGGVTQIGAIGNGTGFGGVAVNNPASGFSLIGPITVVAYDPVNVTTQTVLNTASVSSVNTSVQNAMAALGSLALA